MRNVRALRGEHARDFVSEGAGSSATQTSVLPVDRPHIVRTPGDVVSETYTQQWNRAIADDPEARSEWRVAEGGNWCWSGDALEVSGNGSEWLATEWLRCDHRALEKMSNFIIEVMVAGEGGFAGLSVGPYKDFLVELAPGGAERRLQLRVDTGAGLWGFCVDGICFERQWWDSAIVSIGDLLNGILTLKARNAFRVQFRNLAIRTCSSRCQLSVITTCYRFLQRLRVSLRNWVHQTLNFGDLEVLIVSPNSPDGTHDYLQALMQSYPHVRIREILTSEQRSIAASINAR